MEGLKKVCSQQRNMLVRARFAYHFPILCVLASSFQNTDAPPFRAARLRNTLRAACGACVGSSSQHIGVDGDLLFASSFRAGPLRVNKAYAKQLHHDRSRARP